MKEKIYIGLTPTKEFDELKANLQTYLSMRSRRGSGEPQTFLSKMYLDERYRNQFRRELWKQLYEDNYLITCMSYVKDNMSEGEKIIIDWE